MSISRYHTVGAVARDLRALKELDARLETLGVPPGSLLVESPAMRPHLGPLEQESFSYRWTHPDPAMDRLQEGVAALVGEAAERGEDGAATFDRVRALADDAAGVPRHRAVAAGLAADRRRPPRLTEPWFC